jgi:hypothetical protein
MGGSACRVGVLGFVVLLLAGMPAHPAYPPSPSLPRPPCVWWSDLPSVTWTPQRSDPIAGPSAHDGPQITPRL